MTRDTENRIPFGLRDGALVEVSEVESGLACSCVCPSCKRPLQARKGKIRSHYFAHDPSAGAFRNRLSALWHHENASTYWGLTRKLIPERTYTIFKECNITSLSITLNYEVKENMAISRREFISSAATIFFSIPCLLYLRSFSKYENSGSLIIVDGWILKESDLDRGAFL